jgi:cation:H+ antiporter
MSFACAAATLGDVDLAANSLLGGIAITMIVVALTDLVVGREPLSIDVQHPVVLLQGALVIVMLTVAAAGITAGDRPIPGIEVAGVWTTVLLILYVLSLLLIRRLQRYHPWTPDATPASQDDEHRAEPALADASLSRVVRFAALTTAAVLVAGTVLAFSAHALAEQTGLGSGFVGLLSNMCSVVLLLLVDLLYVKGPIPGELGRFSIFAVLLGTALTAIYLAGLVARPRRPFWRMGIVSVSVLVVAATGFVVLFQLR